MRTFGWSPTDEELKEMVNVIDQVDFLFIDDDHLEDRHPDDRPGRVAMESFCSLQDGDGDISFNEFVWLMTR